jgi:ubiquinone/menaquinone biosynthesis C-methylase UbiE
VTSPLPRGTFGPAIAFDSIADQYDELFTRSVIGRAQRGQVWDALERAFNPGDSVLELNCGTGEDALFLARRGVAVVAADVSEKMIAIARQRHAAEAPQLPISFKHLATEELHLLQPPCLFNGVFSNFSGLNCVADLGRVAQQLAHLVVSGGPALLCFSSRICAWETLWHLGHGQFRRAFRRWRGTTDASVNGISFRVCYPTVGELRRLFSPWFVLRSCIGVGVLVPPSYGEHWARKHPQLLENMSAFDRAICHAPGFRVAGDHMLLHFERTSA